jgi:hypothetical protein
MMSMSVSFGRRSSVRVSIRLIGKGTSSNISVNSCNSDSGNGSSCSCSGSGSSASCKGSRMFGNLLLLV